MWILQRDSLREEVPYKDSELMEQCYILIRLQVTPMLDIKVWHFQLRHVRFQVKKNKEYNKIKQRQQ